MLGREQDSLIASSLLQNQNRVRRINVAKYDIDVATPIPTILILRTITSKYKFITWTNSAITNTIMVAEYDPIARRYLLVHSNWL